MFVKTLFVSISVIFLTSCSSENDVEEKEWTAFVYPDKQNQKRSMITGIYPTIEECKIASLKKLEVLGFKNNGFYRCGLECTYHEGMKTDICTKMEI